MSVFLSVVLFIGILIDHTAFVGRFNNRILIIVLSNGGSLVDSTPFVPRVVDSNPALAAT